MLSSPNSFKKYQIKIKMSVADDTNDWIFRWHLM